MFASKLTRAFAACTALTATALAAPASAQQIDRIIAFGDSYADDGNFFELVGVNPATVPVYTTGRFSGGTNYIDTLAEILDVPVDNFAIGGARTNTGNQTPGLPGFSSEVAIFLSGGGGVFPTVTPIFDEGDLVTVSIGGNDARAYQIGGGTVAGAPVAAATAVAFADAGLDALVAAGAPTISFLAGDTGRLPEVNFYADPTAARTVRTAFSTAFNTGIQESLAGYADDGVIVHYLDLTQILNRIEANLAEYGFSGLACPAFPPPAGPGNPGSGVCAVQSVADTFVFYGDQLHLTSTAFAVVAQYVAAQLDAPLTLQSTGEAGLASAQDFSRTLASHVDVSDVRFGGSAQGLRLFGIVSGDSHNFDETDDTARFKAEALRGTVGVQFGFGNGIAGVAATLARPKIDFARNEGRNKARSIGLGAFAGFDVGGGFVQAQAGFGSDDHKIRRAGVIDDLSASPDGKHVFAGAKAGYLMPFGSFRVGPVVALDYARARVDSYTETGDEALRLNVGRQKLSTMVGQLGVEMRSHLSGHSGLRPYAALVAEKDFDGDDRVVTFSQTTAPGIVNQWTIAGSGKTYGRLSAGASVQLTPAFGIEAAGTATLGRDRGDDLSGQVALQLGF